MKQSEIIIESDLIITPFQVEEKKGILIRDDKIYYIGDLSEARYLANDDAKRIISKRGAVLPAFIDAHTHTIFEGIKSGWLDLSGITSFKDFLRALEEAKKITKPGQWIIGHSWDESHWKDEPRYPTIKDLDEVSTSHPIYVRRIDGHMGVINSKALEILKIPPNMRGFIKNERGEFTGIVKEDTLDYVDKKIQENIINFRTVIEKSFTKLKKLGIASVHEFVSPLFFNALLDYLDKSGNIYRNTVYFWLEYAQKLIDLGFRTNFGNSKIKIGGIKLMMDGSIGARTAALRQPYQDAPSEKGILFHTSDEIEELIKKADKAGLQLAIHAIGDRAIDELLTAYKKSTMIKELRHRIEHFEITHEEHIKTVKKIGVTLSMQPNFVANWQTPGGLYERRLGKARTKIMNQFKTILENSIPMAFGSDCMPMDPLYGIWAAVNHPIKEQRINVIDAITSYTYMGAYLEHSEHFKGSLKEGFIADIIILDKNPLTEKNLRKINVKHFIFGGKIL